MVADALTHCLINAIRPSDASAPRGQAVIFFALRSGIYAAPMYLRSAAASDINKEQPFVAVRSNAGVVRGLGRLPVYHVVTCSPV